jgi:acetate---CoA ligase (ADP-forming)
MLEPARVALVGASRRPGSFGERMVIEASRSTAPVELHLVNPNYSEVLGRPCVPSLDAIDGPVDLVLLGIPDAALETELRRAARRGDRSAVIFGNAYETPQPSTPTLRERLASEAREAGMAVCGAGCMGFVNVARGIRATGYVEPATIPAGPIALVTHSGSVFSAMLRTRRRLGFSLAVSSGQELVTSAASYIDYALDLDETRIVALVLETLRDTPEFRAALERAAKRRIDVFALTVGASRTGRRLVETHSGAIAGADAAWEALFDAYGVMRVSDLEELADALELFSSPRRVPRNTTVGLATVHDSGAERVLVADIAERLDVPFATISEQTRARLVELLDPGLEAMNPLDVWATGANTGTLFTECLLALAADPAVGALALALDFVREYDGDDSYLRAALAVNRSTSKPFAVLANMASAIDTDSVDELRRNGIPVLEGSRSGITALGYLLFADRRETGRFEGQPRPDAVRRLRWRERIAEPRDTATAAHGSVTFSAEEALFLLAEYGIETVRSISVRDESEAIAASEMLGFPVVLKTAQPDVLHKTELGGVALGIRSAAEAAETYRDLAARLGPQVLVSATAPAGVELAMGIVSDPHLGPLVVVAAGGVLVEVVADRAVGLPPIDRSGARRMLARLRIAPMLAGVRGARAVDATAVEDAIMALSSVASEIGDLLDGLDVNPLICGPNGAVAVDALVVSRPRSEMRTTPR